MKKKSTEKIILDLNKNKINNYEQIFRSQQIQESEAGIGIIFQQNN